MTEALSTPSAEITEAVRTVYGQNGADWLQHLQHPGAAAEDIVAQFVEQPTPLHTRFFRESNLEKLARRLERAHEDRPADEQVRVLQIGSSTCEETWSLGALLAAAGLPWHITAVDISTTALRRATQPYRISPAEFERQTDHYQYCRKYFERTPNGIHPTPELKERTTFQPHDLLTGPPPGDGYDAIVINNVLWHFPPATRTYMLANALSALKPGGRFAYEGYTNSSKQAPGYYDWMKTLGEYGLYDFGSSHGSSNILRFQPDWGSEHRKQEILTRLESLRTPPPQLAAAMGKLGLFDESTVPELFRPIEQAEHLLPGDAVGTAIHFLQGANRKIRKTSGNSEELQAISDILAAALNGLYHAKSYFDQSRTDLQEYRNKLIPGKQ